MKTCPACGATYTAHISFCFEDGAVLEAEGKAATGSTGHTGRRVPSRVATPVSPARRGRSLLSNRNRRGLSFTPPTPPPQVPKPADDLTPAPLEPLDIPEGEDVDFPWEPPPEPSPEVAAQAGSEPVETGDDARSSPTPVDASGGLEPAGVDDAEQTFDDLDFPEMGVGEVPYADEPVEVVERRKVPPWLIPAALIVGVLILGTVLIGGAIGLLGSSALQRSGEPPAVAEVEPATPAPAADPVAGPADPAAADPSVADAGTEAAAADPSVADAGTEAAAADVEADPQAAADVEPEPASGTEAAVADVEADPQAAADVEPAPEPASGTEAAVAGIEPDPAPAADVEPAPEPAVDVEPDPEPAVADVEPAPEPGGSPWGSVDVQTSTVSVSSVPGGAEVWLDGERIGTTPLRTEVPYGDYLLEGRLEGYDPAFRDVTVDGEREQFSLELKGQAKSGAVIVVLEGWDGATLYVDGEKRGVLPARLTLTEGTHEFKVESPSGTQSVTRDVVLAEGVTIVNLSG